MALFSIFFLLFVGGSEADKETAGPGAEKNAGPGAEKNAGPLNYGTRKQLT